MSGQSMGQVRVYWLADSVTDAVKARGLALSKQGYDVKMFADFTRFSEALRAQRPAIVVLSDSGTGHSDLTRKILWDVAAINEIRSARMLLVSTVPDASLHELAVACNFRDVIPIDLDRDIWVQRFIYATSSQPKNYKPPMGQLSILANATIGIPARVIWISSDEICLESRARPKAGSEAALGGNLAAWFGVPQIPITIEATRAHALKYHFSEAHIARWQPPGHVPGRLEALFEELQKTSIQPKHRVFVAIQSAALRSRVLQTLVGGPYEIATALKKNAIINEPKYFTPGLVIIEGTFLTPEHLPLFLALIEVLPKESTILVLAPPDNLEALRLTHPSHAIIGQNDLSPAAIGAGVIKALPKVPLASEIPRGAQELPSTHPLSLGEILYQGRVIKLHPTSVQLALPQSVGKFGIIKITSPLFDQDLGRSPFGKVTSAHVDLRDSSPSLPYRVDCYLADVGQAEQGKLALTALNSLIASYGRFFPASLPKEMRPLLQSFQTDRDVPFSATGSVPANANDGLSSTASPPALSSMSLPDKGPTEPIQDPRIKEAITDQAKPKVGAAAPKKAATAPTPPNSTNKNLRATGIPLIITILTVLLMVALFFWLSQVIQPSGSVYSEQLRRFAPQHSE